MPDAYVTFHPHPSVEKHSTAVVQASTSPCWDYQCVTHIPNLHLEAEVGAPVMVTVKLLRSHFLIAVPTRLPSVECWGNPGTG